jgi:hypothetical protein
MAEKVAATLAPGEVIANMDPNGPKVIRAADPVISPTYATPGDFAGQFPNPLDPTEIIDLCEEIGVWSAIPEIRTGLKTYTWRELTAMDFTLTGVNYLAFADGLCPEEYGHSGGNSYVDLKNIGVKKSLSISDIMHSAAAINVGWGISALVGGYAAGEGFPGGQDAATFMQEQIADLKEKEIRLGMTLTLNGWDDYLVNGSVNTSALQFNGIVAQVTAVNGAHSSTLGASGTFSATSYNQYLTESCAKPTTIFGHPAAIQEFMAAYFGLGFNGSQIIMNPAPGNRIEPGYNFTGFVNTGIGRLAVVADIRFPRTVITASTFQSNLYALRMTHNGEPLVHKITQIPLALKDLVPGCTAIAFEIWAKTALVIKAMCAQGVYTGLFSGRVTTTCSVIG